MPTPTRTVEGVYDALNSIGKEINVDFGMSKYDKDSFKQKYGTEQGMRELHGKLKQISAEENADFGFPDNADDFVGSFTDLQKTTAPAQRTETASAQPQIAQADNVPAKPVEQPESVETYTPSKPKKVATRVMTGSVKKDGVTLRYYLDGNGNKIFNPDDVAMLDMSHGQQASQQPLPQGVSRWQYENQWTDAQRKQWQQQQMKQAALMPGQHVNTAINNRSDIGGHVASSAGAWAGQADAVQKAENKRVWAINNKTEQAAKQQRAITDAQSMQQMPVGFDGKPILGDLATMQQRNAENQQMTSWEGGQPEDVADTKADEYVDNEGRNTLVDAYGNSYFDTVDPESGFRLSAEQNFNASQQEVHAQRAAENKEKRYQEFLQTHKPSTTEPDITDYTTDEEMEFANRQYNEDYEFAVRQWYEGQVERLQQEIDDNAVGRNIAMSQLTNPYVHTVYSADNLQALQDYTVAEQKLASLKQQCAEKYPWLIKSGWEAWKQEAKDFRASVDVAAGVVTGIVGDFLANNDSTEEGKSVGRTLQERADALQEMSKEQNESRTETTGMSADVASFTHMFGASVASAAAYALGQPEIGAALATTDLYRMIFEGAANQAYEARMNGASNAAAVAEGAANAAIWSVVGKMLGTPYNKLMTKAIGNTMADDAAKAIAKAMNVDASRAKRIYDAMGDLMQQAAKRYGYLVENDAKTVLTDIAAGAGKSAIDMGTASALCAIIPYLTPDDNRSVWMSKDEEEAADKMMEALGASGKALVEGAKDGAIMGAWFTAMNRGVRAINHRKYEGIWGNAKALRFAMTKDGVVVRIVWKETDTSPMLTYTKDVNGNDVECYRAQLPDGQYIDVPVTQIIGQPTTIKRDKFLKLYEQSRQADFESQSEIGMSATTAREQAEIKIDFQDASNELQQAWDGFSAEEKQAVNQALANRNYTLLDGILTPEHLNVAEAYLKAKLKFDGIVNGVHQQMMDYDLQLSNIEYAGVTIGKPAEKEIKNGGKGKRKKRNKNWKADMQNRKQQSKPRTVIEGTIDVAGEDGKTVQHKVYVLSGETENGKTVQVLDADTNGLMQMDFGKIKDVNTIDADELLNQTFTDKMQQINDAKQGLLTRNVLEGNEDIPILMGNQEVNVKVIGQQDGANLVQFENGEQRLMTTDQLTSLYRDALMKSRMGMHRYEEMTIDSLGGKESPMMPEGAVPAGEEPTATTEEAEAAKGFKEGDKVGFEQDGQLVEGTITGINEDGTYDVSYGDGEVPMVLNSDQLVSKEALDAVRGESGETSAEEATALPVEEGTPAAEVEKIKNGGFDAEETEQYIANNEKQERKNAEEAYKQMAEIQLRKPKMGTDLDAYKAEKEQWQKELDEATARKDAAEAKQKYWEEVRDRMQNPDKYAPKAEEPEEEVVEPAVEPTEAKGEEASSEEPAKVAGVHYNGSTDIKSIANEVGVDEQELSNLDAVCKKLGIDVSFDNILRNSKGQIENAHVTPDGRILISRFALDQGYALHFLLGHELTHTFDNATKDKIADAAKKYMGEEKYKAVFNRKEPVYKVAYAKAMKGMTEDEKGAFIGSIIREEIACDFAGKILKGEFLDAAAGADLDFGQKMLNGISRIKAKVMGMLKPEQQAAITAAEQAWSAAVEKRMREQGTPEGDEDARELHTKASIDTLCESVGLLYDRGEDGRTIFTDLDGKEVKEVTREMLEASPLGYSLGISVGSKLISKEDAEKQYKFFGELFNNVLRTNDLDLVFAVSGALAFGERAEMGRERDNERKSPFHALTSNSDDQYQTTFDVTTVCLKTKPIIDAMSKTMVEMGRGLKPEEIVNILYDETAKAGEAVPCPVCYVFSRWVGNGNILENIKKWQNETASMSDAELTDMAKGLNDRIVSMRNDLLNAGKKNHSMSDAKQKVINEMLDQVAKTLGLPKAMATEMVKDGKLRDLLDAAKSVLDYKEIYEAYNRKKGKRVPDSKKLTIKDKTLLSSLKSDLELIDMYAWLTKARLNMEQNKDTGILENKTDEEGNVVPFTYTPVPNDVLFDMNAGKEFAEKYPSTWAYRTSRGPAAGKAITPYAPHHFGDMLAGLEAVKEGDKPKAFLKDWNTVSTYKSYLKSVAKAMAQNLIGGQRMQSTSDFRPEYATDYLIAMLEQQVLGSKVQLYTKVPEAVRFLASCGAEVNMSLMAYGDGYKLEGLTADEIKAAIPLLEENKSVDEQFMQWIKEGKIVPKFSAVTGMDDRDAFRLAELYDNAQPIIVGINDIHMRLMMADPRITFMIPFHASGGTEDAYRTMMQILEERVENRTDYSRWQEDAHKGKESSAWKTRMKILSGYADGKDRSKDGVDNTLTDAERNEVASFVITNADGNEVNILHDLYKRFYGTDVYGNEVSAEDKQRLFGGNEVDEECFGVHLDTKQRKHIFPYEYWDKTTNIDTAWKNGDTFKAYCDAMDIIPRFTGMEKTKQGIKKTGEDFSTSKGYWKVLIDRKMYNNDGTYHEPKAIDLTGMNQEFWSDVANRNTDKPVRQEGESAKDFNERYRQWRIGNRYFQNEAGESFRTPSKLNDPSKTAGIVKNSLERLGVNEEKSVPSGKRDIMDAMAESNRASIDEINNTDEMENYLSNGEYTPSKEESKRIYDLNTKFNSELDNYDKLPANHVFQIGTPSAYLRSTTVPVPDLPITLRRSVVERKSNMDRHIYAPSELRNLVAAIQKPLAVFAYGDPKKGQNLMIDIEHGEKHFLVGLAIEPEVNGKSLDIISISNTFPKDNPEWLTWVRDGRLLRIDGKTEIQDIISTLRMAPVDYAKRYNLDFNSLANIVNNFQNPKLSENNIQVKGENRNVEVANDNNNLIQPGESILDYAKRVEQRQVNELKDSVGKKYSLMGEMGADNLDMNDDGDRIKMLQVAKDMEENKDSAKKIRIVTGWERGADGKWRYEIPDGTIKNYDLMQTWKNQYDHANLEDVWDDEDLYKAYPDLRGMHVYKTKKGSGIEGGFTGGYIEVNPKQTEEELRKTFVHEIQHYIQSQEGFARGGNEKIVSEEAKKLAEEQEKAAKDIETKLAKKYPFLAVFSKYGSVGSIGHDKKVTEQALEYINQAEEMIEKYPEFFGNVSPRELGGMLGIFNGSRLAMEIQRIYGGYREEAAPELYRFLNNIDGNKYRLTYFPTSKELVEQTRDAINNALDTINAYEKKFNNKWKKLGFDGYRYNGEIGFEGYKRLAGEVESRNAEERIDMTDEQRSKTPLSKTEDVARKNQLFRFTGDNGLYTSKDMEMMNKHSLDEDANIESPRYLGAPYTGSKSRIARDLVNILPDGKRFVDLFSGGGAMTHAAMLSGKYDNFHINDVRPIGQRLFLDGIDGKYSDYQLKDIKSNKDFMEIADTPEALLYGYSNRPNKSGAKQSEYSSRLARVKGLSALQPIRDKLTDSETDYKDVRLRKGDVLYADIPYEDSDNSAYGEAGNFDYKAFSEWAKNIDQPVYVSSVKALEGFTEIWSKDIPGRTEKLFVQDKFADQERARISEQERGNMASLDENDAEYMQAVESGDMDTAQRMVNEKADRELNETLQLPDDSGEIGFAYHRGAAPKKTRTMYAVLNVNPDGFRAAYAGNKTATPVGVWLDAKPLQGFDSDLKKNDDGSWSRYVPGDTGHNWKDCFSPEAYAKIMDENPEITKSTKWLYERGGKHGSDVPNFSQMNLRQDENGNKVRSPKQGALPHNKLVFEIECGMDENGDLTEYVKENGRFVKKKNQGLKWVGNNKFYFYKTNPNAVGNWGIAGTFRIKRLVPYDEIVEESKNAGVPLQKWVGGYHPEDSGLTVDTVDKMYQEGQKMKLMDAVTYDDNGNVIPLSQRFNPEIKGDARYSLDENQEVQVHSDNFKNWFGDWQFNPRFSSKVVDKEGKPLVMSHNTNNEFWTFDRDKIGTGQGQSYLGVGFNFSRGGASVYGSNEMKAYLDIKHPMTSKKVTLTRSDVRNIIRELDNKSGERIEDSWGTMNDCINALFDYAEGDLDIYATIGMTYYGKGTDVMDVFKRYGYDGTIEYDNDGNVRNAVVFSSNQIKSATDNNGDFDPSNPDIRYSLDENSVSEDDYRPTLPTRNEGESLFDWAKRIDETRKAQRQWDKEHPITAMTDDDARNIVKERINAIPNEHVSQVNKRLLNSIMSAIKDTNAANLRPMLEEADELVRYVEKRAIESEVDKLLATKGTTKDAKKMLVGKGVDIDTQEILKRVNGTLADDEMMRLEDEIHKLRSENWHLRADGGRTLSDEAKQRIEENNASIREMQNQVYDIVNKKITVSKEGIDKQIQELSEKMSEAIDNDRYKDLDQYKVQMTALELQKSLLDAKESEYSRIGYKKGYDKATELYQAINKQLSTVAPEGTDRAGMYAEINEQLPEGAKIDSDNDATSYLKALQNQKRAYASFIQQCDQQYLDKLSAFRDQLKSVIKGGRESLAEQIEEEKERRREIVRGCIRDLTGKHKPYDMRKTKEHSKTSLAKSLFSSGLDSFEYMAQRIGTRTMGKDTYFYQRFVSGENGVIAANNTYIDGMRTAKERLDMKCQQIFGKKFDACLEDAAAKKGSGYVTVRVVDEEMNPLPSERIELTKGQATYMYMLWKMPDGKAKLQKMGFDEDSIDDCKRVAGKRNLEWADWVQSTLLPEMREKYNERYREMYRTNMAAIDNYVPIRINGGAIRNEVDLTGDTGAGAGSLQLKNGALVNRTVNVKPIDLNVNAFDLVFDHLNDMEQWYAFAPVRRDLGYVMSSQTFRNQMNYNNHGSFNRLLEAAKVAVRGSQLQSTDISGMDRAWATLNKGLVGGNIAFRNTTALKQMLSVPAYYGYSQDPRFLAALTKNIFGQYIGNAMGIATNMATFGSLGERMFANAEQNKMWLKSGLTETVGWCMREMPDFWERVTSGTAGLTHMDDEGLSNALGKFVDGYMKQGMRVNQMVDAITVAIGVKSIYDYKMARSREYIQKLADEMMWETPEKKQQWIDFEMGRESNKAKMEATIYYNATQQSNHPAFLSPMQVNKGVLQRSLTLYKNSPTGYARKTAESIQDLVRYFNPETRNAMMNEYVRRFVDEGHNEQEAEEMASAYLNNAARKASVSAVLYGLVMNHIWNIGGKGLLGILSGYTARQLMLGLFNDDDKDKSDVQKALQYWSTVPLNGLPGADIISAVANMKGLNPVSLLPEATQQAVQQIDQVSDQYGITSPEMAWMVFSRMGRIYGVNPDVWCNVYLGAERMARDGWKDGDEAVIDLMLLLNSPESNRAQVAKNLFKDREDYVEKVERAMKYGRDDSILEKYDPALKEKNDKKETELYKEFVENNLTDEERQRAEEYKKASELIDQTDSYDDLQMLYDSTDDLEIRKKIRNKMDKADDKPKTAKQKEADYKKELLGNHKPEKGDEYNSINTAEDVTADQALDDMISIGADENKEYNRLKKEDSRQAWQYLQEHPNVTAHQKASKVKRKIGELKGKLKNATLEEQQQLMQQIRDLRSDAINN